MRQALPLLSSSICLLLLLGTGCQREGAAIDAPFSDDFSGESLASHWRDTGGGYRVVDGALRCEKAYNHPLWLNRPLPAQARIEFEAWTDGKTGDIKVELYGDGKSHAVDKGQYMSTGYVAVFGGWKNRVSVLARMDEHGGDRKERRRPKVEQGKRYRFKIERSEMGPKAQVRWFIDDALFLEYEDTVPLRGEGHRFFAFNDWENLIWFDNLRIEPL